MLNGNKTDKGTKGSMSIQFQLPKEACRWKKIKEHDTETNPNYIKLKISNLVWFTMPCTIIYRFSEN